MATSASISRRRHNLSSLYGLFLLIHQFLSKIEVEASYRETIRQASLKAASYLIDNLEKSSQDRLWTGEAWSNGQILWAVTKSGVFPISNESLLRKTLHWFESAQEEDGNWSDIEDTASAIIGLHSLLKQITSSDGKRNPDELYMQLRNSYSTPPLYINRPFIEKQKETGGISINLSHKFITIISYAVPLAAIVATLETLFDFVWNHWIKK